MEQHPIKTRNQLRRAHKLVNILDQLDVGCCNETRLLFAQRLPAAKWADVAYLAGISVPSADTIAMVTQLLEARVTNEQLTADADFMAFTGVDTR